MCANTENMSNLYKFEPLLKQTLWGGNRLASFKHLDMPMDGVGESWEVSGVEGSVSIVAEGPYKGKSLTELVLQLKGDLVGKKNFERFGSEFPLLVKFIDAHQDLSIQVHPNDEVARRHGYSHGKTEMWYCLEGEKGEGTGDKWPILYCGLKQVIAPEEYARMGANDTICDALAQYEVHEGDMFFIPAGRIHSIGAGCLVAEIQQTSDVTYRIYDFGRRDKNGNLRQLHTREAAESIDYTVLPNYRTLYRPLKNARCAIARCPQFATAVYDLDRPTLLDYRWIDSFVILMGLKGSATLNADGQRTSLRAGETVLVPATVKEIKVEGTIKFLETYI